MNHRIWLTSIGLLTETLYFNNDGDQGRLCSYKIDAISTNQCFLFSLCAAMQHLQPELHKINMEHNLSRIISYFHYAPNVKGLCIESLKWISRVLWRVLKRRMGSCLSILLGALTDDNCLAAADSAQAVSVHVVR